MDKENIQRVDNRSGSVYSIIIFIFVFTFCYLFYPQMSMLLPFLGENETVSRTYEKVGFDSAVKEAETVVIGVCSDKGKTEYTLTQSASEPVIVYKNVVFNVEQTVKGNAEENVSLHEFGGSVLLANGNSRKKKYNVSYTDEPTFKKNKKYVLFIDGNGEILFGKYGVAIENSDGTFTDGMNNTYSVNDLIKLVAEAG